MDDTLVADCLAASELEMMQAVRDTAGVDTGCYEADIEYDEVDTGRFELDIVYPGIADGIGY